MEELDSNQMLAVEEFAKGLRECFTNKMKSGDTESLIFMTYALQVLEIHLSLAEIKFQRYTLNYEMAVAHGK